MTTGLLPLSADPVTFGHLDLVEKALTVVDHLTVVIAENPDKSPVFTPKERVALMQRAILDFIPESGKRVLVVDSPGTMPDLVLEWNTDLVFRGIRNGQDKKYELQQTKFYTLAAPWTDWKKRIHFLQADPKLGHISSTVVREFGRRYLDLTQMAPMYVQVRLWRKLHQQKVLGIMGTDAVAVGESLISLLQQEGLPCGTISLTQIDCLLDADTSPGGVLLALGQSEDLRFAHRDRVYRKLLQENEGKLVLILGDLDSAGFIPRVNNNVVLLGKAEEKQKVLDLQEGYHYGTLLHHPDSKDLIDLSKTILKVVRRSLV